MKASDTVRTMETLRRDGVLVASCGGLRTFGEVEVLYRSKRNGKPIFTHTKERNSLLVTGGVFLNEKINNLRSSFLTSPLDVEQGVHTYDDLDRSNATVPQEMVCGITIGCGGCDDTYNTVHKVHKTDHSVPGLIPFRVVELADGDLPDSIRNQYFLRVVRGDRAWYYGKKFSVAREINVRYEDGTVVPTNVDTVGDSDGRVIRTFTKYDAIIDESDVREYFKYTDGNTIRSRVNSIGLVTGYPGLASDGAEEFFNVRGMTTLNMENMELKDRESTIEITYRFYFA